ncbi:MAG: hypothetical protein AAGI17_11535 [Planctomycetota bacterium]
MHREGADPDSMDMADILCDFCAQPWSDERPMVEGHRGSCICGRCLTIAWVELMETRISDDPGEGESCCLCLESDRPDPHWRSPIFEGKLACRRCVKQAAGALHKDREIEWTKPGRGPSDAATSR